MEVKTNAKESGPTVKVCDMIMGAGKTESAITRMNEDLDSRYIFITPFLTEVERIKESCSARGFVSPENSGHGKLDSLHNLLREKRNIVSTHALFRAYTDETIGLIRDGGYKLILDEVCDVVEKINIHKDDIEILLKEKIIQVLEDCRIEWIGNEYHGKFADELMDACKTGNVMLFNRNLMLWMFPVEVFGAFSDVTVLTYMFDAQYQKYYFDMNGIKTKRIGSVHDETGYRFCEDPCIPDYVRELKSKIHILDNKKLNQIGDSRTALSATWYRVDMERGGKNVARLRANLNNVYKHIYHAKADNFLWTSFCDYKDTLGGNGYKNDFLACNARSTSKYADRCYLAYCVNIFYNPFVKNFFSEKGVFVNQDKYALSEMLQWLWRGSIRHGNDMWVYIPSKRMRELFISWLNGLERQYSE